MLQSFLGNSLLEICCKRFYLKNYTTSHRIFFFPGFETKPNNKKCQCHPLKKRKVDKITLYWSYSLFIDAKQIILGFLLQLYISLKNHLLGLTSH